MVIMHIIYTSWNTKVLRIILFSNWLSKNIWDFISNGKQTCKKNKDKQFSLPGWANTIVNDRIRKKYSGLHDSIVRSYIAVLCTARHGKNTVVYNCRKRNLHKASIMCPVSLYTARVKMNAIVNYINIHRYYPKLW